MQLLQLCATMEKASCTSQMDNYLGLDALIHIICTTVGSLLTLLP